MGVLVVGCEFTDPVPDDPDPDDPDPDPDPVPPLPDPPFWHHDGKAKERRMNPIVK